MPPETGLMYPLNTITALPMLQLTCALDGREAGDLVLVDAWERFLEFCHLPTDATEDHIGFQVDVARIGLDVPSLTIRLVRQLTDAAGASGTGTRAVFVDFMFDHPPAHLEGGGWWLEDFPSMDSFRSAMEATPEFEWAVKEPASSCGFGADRPED